jgi:hypothetical protein
LGEGPALITVADDACLRISPEALTYHWLGGRMFESGKHFIFRKWQGRRAGISGVVIERRS